MATKLDDLFFEITVRKGAGADQTLGTFEGRLKGVGDSAKGAGDRVKGFGDRAQQTEKKSASLGVVLKRLFVIFGGFFILRAVGRAITNFQTRIAEIATIADDAVTDVDALRAATIQLSLESPQSAEELGAGAYQILSAGIVETSDVIEVLRISSRAATAGLTDTATAVNGVTTVLNAFNLPASEAARIADELFTTVRLGKVRFEELAGSIGNAATSAALAGVSTQELLAGIVAITKAGVGAAEATSSLNRLFLTLTNQSKEQEQAFRDLGIEFNTTTVAQRGFAGLLEEVNELTDANIDALAALFPNIRAARAAFIVAGQGAESFTKALEELANAEGAIDAAFEEINKTFEAQAAILRNNLIAIFIEASQSVLPGLVSVIQVVNRNLTKFLGGIKLLGADAAVAFGALELFGRQGIEAVSNFVISSLETIAGFADKVASILGGIAATGLPGAGLAQLGADLSASIADSLRDAAESEDTFAERAREATAAAREQLGFLKEGRDAVQAQVIAESDFASKRAATLAVTQALADAERERGRLSEEQLKKRAELEQELADRIQEITLTAAEQEIADIAKLRAAFVKEFGEISLSAEKNFLQVEAAAREALRVETARKLADDFRKALEEGLEDIEFETIAIAGDEARTAAILDRQVKLFDQLLTRARARLKSAELTTEEERELRGVIVEIEKALRGATDGQEAFADAARRDAEDRFRDLQSTLSLINQAADGALDLAESFGVVDSEIRRVLDSLTQIGTGVATLISALATGNVAGIIAGGLGVLGGLTSLGAAEDAARQKILISNTKALRDLSREVVNLAGSFDIAGTEFEAALRGIELLQARIAELPPTISELPLDPERVAAILAQVGVSLEDLDRVAAELGITIRDASGNIIPGAIDQLAEALQLLEDSLIGLPNTIGGALERFRLELEFFDITDPIEQFRLLQEALLEIQQVDPAEIFRIMNDETLTFGQRIAAVTRAFAEAGANITPFLAELLAIDVTTPEGRAEAQAVLEQLFLDLIEGRITPEELGAATFEEAIGILLQMEGLLDEISEQEGDAGEEIGGQTQDIRRNIQITELQGNQLLAFQSTIAERATQAVDLLTRILSSIGGITDGFEPIVPPVVGEIEPIGPPIQLDGPAGGAPLIGEVTINQEVTIGAGATEEEVSNAREILVDDLADDLGQRLIEAERLRGLPAIRRSR